MTIYEIVKKLVGQVKPIGETQEDDRRLNNLRDTIELVDLLLSDISEVSSINHRGECSIVKAKKVANEFIKEMVFTYKES